MSHKHIFAPLAWVAVLGLVMGLEGLSARSDLPAGFNRIFDGRPPRAGTSAAPSTTAQRALRRVLGGPGTTLSVTDAVLAVMK